MSQRVLQLQEGSENGLSYDFVFLSIFLLGKFLLSQQKAKFFPNLKKTNGKNKEV